jgi:hypothetical protein
MWGCAPTSFDISCNSFITPLTRGNALYIPEPSKHRIYPPDDHNSMLYSLYFDQFNTILEFLNFDELPVQSSSHE